MSAGTIAALEGRERNLKAALAGLPQRYDGRPAQWRARRYPVTEADTARWTATLATVQQRLAGLRDQAAQS